jgi:hypothetical protein
VTVLNRDNITCSLSGLGMSSAREMIPHRCNMRKQRIWNFWARSFGQSLQGFDTNA